MNINGKTKVIGIFGWPVEHTFSPAMHNAAFARLGLNCVYIPFPVEPAGLGQAVAGIRALGLAGVNVTIPHKSAVMEFLDEIAPEARLIGAVNTIVNDKGRLVGYNTDAPGFLKSLELEGGITPAGKRVLILGAGGAARAVSVQLALAGASVIVFSAPRPEKAVRLQELITSNTTTRAAVIPWDPGKISESLAETDILINATPVGMYPHTGEKPPVEVRVLPKGALVCDLIYNPRETLFLREARESGMKTLNGMGMLLYQGAIAFELWTKCEPPLDIMRKALEEQLTKGN